VDEKVGTVSTVNLELRDSSYENEQFDAEKISMDQNKKGDRIRGRLFLNRI
jgi:hypothetical protein